jgi:hypothetical protein
MIAGDVMPLLNIAIAELDDLLHCRAQADRENLPQLEQDATSNLRFPCRQMFEIASSHANGNTIFEGADRGHPRRSVKECDLTED